MTQSQNINVYLRCRPLKNGEQQSTLECKPNDNEVLYNPLGKVYSFDRVFSADASQGDVYRTVVKPLINDVLSGLSCTVFAYGQTGTGKTYTMEGDSTNEDGSGVIPRAIAQIFESLVTRSGEFAVRVSFLELYNEEAYDLLSGTDDTSKLRIYDDVQRKNSVRIEGLNETTIESAPEIFDILMRGSLKRQTAATLLNAHSSRSHSIFSISVLARELDDQEFKKVGKLNLVDLAGSENIARSGAQNKNAREAGNINQSLLTLTRVITALVEKRPHIPYRESKLTRILQDSLGGTTRTSMIATVSQAEADISNTISTLDYASRARCITNQLDYNRFQNHNNKKCGCKDHEREKLELIEKHANELSQQEFRIRNEVAMDFRREVEKKEKQQKEDMENFKIRMQEQTKQLEHQVEEFEQQISTLNQQLDKQRQENDQLKQKIQEESEKFKQHPLDEIDQLKRSHEQELDQIRQSHQEEIDHLKQKLKNSENEAKLINRMCEVKADEVLEIQMNLQTEKARVQQLEQELEQYKRQRESTSKITEKVPEKDNEKDDSPESPQDPDPTPTNKKPPAKRVRKQAPAKANDYANLTFDGDDEIVQVSTKKIHKKLTGAIKREMCTPLTLSGKKKRLTKPDVDYEVSPISPPVRVTRNRARRKLNL